MNKFTRNLKEQAEEQPMLAIMAGTTVITIAVSLLKVVGELYGRLVWSKEVKRRTKHSKK